MESTLFFRCDCFGVIHYFDAYLCDINGKANKVENVICLHEEDAGLLFKHTDWHSGRRETMRNRKLVISSIATLANYEYAFYWYLFLDGKIESEVKLTGVVSVGACETRDPKYGTLLGPNLYAPIHEHYFCYRMDFALDGVNNSVVRVDVQAEEDDDKNPYKSAFYSKSIPLKTDFEAQGVVDTAKATYWKIINPNVLNELGNPVGYKLMPKGNVFPYAKEGSSVMKRAGFTKKHFWATPYDADEYYAGGKFPMQNDDGDNLEKWASKGHSVENRDIVVCDVKRKTRLRENMKTMALPCIISLKLRKKISTSEQVYFSHK
uniref:Amine oxidase n=1 Tax=Romanomermis culicivorax TaxID=13658 RepID=A0A915HME7_ROMCU